MLSLPPLQGSRAPPWWLSHFLVSERVLFGTWDGVFTSCLINIFGVIVFLRSGWIVAEAGIASSALIVLGRSVGMQVLKFKVGYNLYDTSYKYH